MLKARLRRDADREQDLQQARTGQPFRRDGGAAEIGVKPIELAIEARQGATDDPPARAQRMTGGDPLFEIDIPEQRSGRLVCIAHAVSAIDPQRVDRVLQSASRPGYFSSLPGVGSDGLMV